MRQSIRDMELKKFMTTDEDIWDLKYISTSDEEDNDSDLEDGEESEESEEEESKAVPSVFKKFKRTGTKGPARIQYTYNYTPNAEGKQQEKPTKTALVNKRVERKGPENIIDLLILNKLNVYEREQRMQLLKENDD